jgi:hypothetical protein
MYLSKFIQYLKIEMKKFRIGVICFYFGTESLVLKELILL